MGCSSVQYTRDDINLRQEMIDIKVDSIHYKKELLHAQSLINLITSRFPNADITILVCPFNPIFRIKNRKAIKSMKRLFYEVVGKHKDKTRIIDCFCWSNKIFDYKDHCHLTIRAAKKFTEYLNIQLDTAI